MSVLAKLLALANRPGYVAEGELAAARARRLAEREGRRIIERNDGTLVDVDEWHADLHDGLRRIADPPTPAHLEGGHDGQ